MRGKGYTNGPTKSLFMTRMCRPHMTSSIHGIVLSEAKFITGEVISVSTAYSPSPLSVLLLNMLDIDIVLTFYLFSSSPCTGFHFYTIVGCIKAISLLLPLRLLGHIDLCIWFLQVLNLRSPWISASLAEAQRLSYCVGAT